MLGRRAQCCGYECRGHRCCHRVGQRRGFTVTVVPQLASINRRERQVQVFEATVTGTTNTAVTWATTAGSIDQNGLYTAPATAGTNTVIATSVANPKVSGRALVNVNANAVQVTPNTFTLGWTESKQFTATISGVANQAVTWSATGGTISSTGVFTAGTTGGAFTTITATSVALTDPLTGTAQVTINPIVITVKPNPGNVVTGQPLQMAAVVAGPNNKNVTWSTTGGTINASGLLTAPTSPTTLTVTATSTIDPAVNATASVVVVSPSSFFYDFNSGVPGVWAPTTNESTPSGIPFLGRLSGTNAATLVLDNLTTHTSITLTFDLFVIGAWGGITPANTMTVSVGGTTGFAQSFSNQLNMLQSYATKRQRQPTRHRQHWRKHAWVHQRSRRSCTTTPPITSRATCRIHRQA